MKRLEPTVLKIGGSVITDKDVELQVHMEALSRLADEIQQANIRDLVIVHGGGSFGHPLAKRYNLPGGLKDETQKIGFSETHHIMTVLNGLFMDALIWRKIPAVSINPSSFVITRSGRIETFEHAPIAMMLAEAFIPVLYGDAVMDSELGFTVLSGDQLVSALAIRLAATRVIVGADVDGLYTADPKTDKSAEIFSHLTLAELRELQDRLGKSNACDVTGGMHGKVAELIPAVEQGIPILIVNAAKPGYVFKALRAKRVKGTLIEKE